MKELQVKIILRNGTEAQWISSNPVLLEGEVAITTSERSPLLKIGNGRSHWADLDYLSGDVKLSSVFTIEHQGEAADAYAVGLALDEKVSIDQLATYLASYVTSTTLSNTLINYVKADTLASLLNEKANKTDKLSNPYSLVLKKSDGTSQSYDGSSAVEVNLGAGGSIVVANDTTGTPTGTLSAIKIDGKSYDIPPSGTEVVPNPSTAATSTLTKIRVGNTTYDIQSGSSGTTVVPNDTTGAPSGNLTAIKINNQSYTIPQNVLLATYGSTAYSALTAARNEGKILCVVYSDYILVNQTTVDGFYFAGITNETEPTLKMVKCTSSKGWEVCAANNKKLAFSNDITTLQSLIAQDYQKKLKAGAGISIDPSTNQISATISPGSIVSVSASGSSTNQVKYITIDGTQYQLAGSGSDLPFNSIDSTTLKVTNKKLAVNTTQTAQEGSAQPITSGGVYTIVGNIEALLSSV